MSWGVRKYNEEEAKRAEQENTFEVLPEGWYEVFITKVDPNAEARNTGSKGIEFVYTIRDDVEQAGQKRKIFDTIWMVKGDGTESGAAKRLDVLASKIGLPSGVDISPDTVVDLFHGKPVKIQLEIDEYEGKKRNRVAFMGFKHAEHGGRYDGPNAISTSAPTEDPFAGPSGSVDIGDDDLPF